MLLVVEDLDILNNPPVYPQAGTFGIKQIDVNESLFQNNSTVLFINDEGLSPVLKVFGMDGIQVGNDYTPNEIKPGNYIFSISYLILKTLHGLTIGNYLIVVNIGQVGFSRIVEISNSAAVNDTANGGFR